MIAVKQAVEIALEQASLLGHEEVDLTQARGRVLAEDIFSDIDMPPFEKAMMDGYALRAQDCQSNSTILKVVGKVAAGTVPDFVVQAGEAAKIMTGAPLPDGADAVQMIEKTAAVSPDRVKILEPIASGKHVAHTGEVMSAGIKVVEEGSYISSAVIGLLATVGKERARVCRLPEVGILVTGDELVDVGQQPAPGQIRNSNGPVLYNQVRELGAEVELLGVASDNFQELRDKIMAGLEKDVLLISGGVSMGEFDLVEDALQEMGVKIHYEKINIKPGKPTVFGTQGKKLIFGLPGNPVSASTILEIIVKPALRKMMGMAQPANQTVRATLQTNFTSKTKREAYHPAITSLQEGRFVVEPVASKGSADVFAYASSNSYLVMMPEVDSAKTGDTVEVILRDEFYRTLPANTPRTK